jgi:hypothetical protein
MLILAAASAQAIELKARDLPGPATPWLTQQPLGYGLATGPTRQLSECVDPPFGSSMARYKMYVDEEHNLWDRHVKQLIQLNCIAQANPGKPQDYLREHGFFRAGDFIWRSD